MTLYVDPELGLAVVERLGFYVRDKGLLLSALARPSASAFGTDAYETLENKAAALFSSLARNHSLLDGNKRTAWVLTVAFLNLNGIDIDMTQDEKFELVLDVAQGADLEQIAEILATHFVADS